MVDAALLIRCVPAAHILSLPFGALRRSSPGACVPVVVPGEEAVSATTECAEANKSERRLSCCSVFPVRARGNEVATRGIGVHEAWLGKGLNSGLWRRGQVADRKACESGEMDAGSNKSEPRLAKKR